MLRENKHTLNDSLLRTKKPHSTKNGPGNIDQC